MADSRFVIDYPALQRHRSELEQQRLSRRRRLFMAVPAAVSIVALAAWWSLPLAFMLAGVAGLVLFFLALPGTSSVDAGALAGAEGEAAVLAVLEQLPDEFLLLNRVKLPDETLGNGERELDFLVAGPSGLWLIEVKNTPGHLRIEPTEKHWPLVRRAGCGSRPTWNAMPNPARQVHGQIQALERWLLRYGVHERPRALIVMAHPEASVENGAQAEPPVLVREQLLEHLSAAAPRQSGMELRQALGALRAA